MPRRKRSGNDMAIDDMQRELKRTRTCYAVTSTGGDDFIVGGGEKSNCVQAKWDAEVEIGANLPAAQRDIYTQTKMKNLRLLSKTAAQRRYGKSAWQQMIEDWLTRDDY